MPNDHKAIVLQVLSHHIGKGRGISMRELEQRIDLTPRLIRRQITLLRDDGNAICGTPQDGYYIAADARELEETCDFLHERALHSLKLEAKLRKIPLPDLLGQLHVPT